MKKNFFQRMTTTLLVLTAVISFAAFPLAVEAAALEEESYGMLITLDDEEAFYAQASAGGGKSFGSCVFIDMYESNRAPSIQFNFDRSTFGSVDSIRKPAGAAWTIEDPFYFKYNKDLIKLALGEGKSPELSLDKDDEWELTILDKHGSVYEGTLKGTFGRGKHTIDAYFLMNIDKESVNTTNNTAYQLYDRLFGGGSTVSRSTIIDTFFGENNKKPNVCRVCGGNGSCHICGGKGRVFNDSIFVNANKTCSICYGDGVCNGCGGKGHH